MVQFTYNASALGAGGVIERDGGRVVSTIPSIASVALAPTGGEGRTVVTNYFSEELEFSHAETRVYGRQTKKGRKPEDAQFTTFTYVLIRDLHIFDRLHVGQMRATVTSTRGFEVDDDHRFELDASYDNVEIGMGKDRELIIPHIDVKLRDLRRYEELNGFVPELEGFGDPRRKISSYAAGLARRFNVKSAEDARKLVGRIHDRKAVQGSIVEHVKGRGDGPVITIPGLGEAHFGELMLKPGRRRLNLLRIDLGKPQAGGNEGVTMDAAPMDEELLGQDLSGSITMGSVEGNGTPIEP